MSRSQKYIGLIIVINNNNNKKINVYYTMKVMDNLEGQASHKLNNSCDHMNLPRRRSTFHIILECSLLHPDVQNCLRKEIWTGQRRNDGEKSSRPFPSHVSAVNYLFISASPTLFSGWQITERLIIQNGRKLGEKANMAYFSTALYNSLSENYGS
jgi:hypothetical protein